MAAVYMIPLGNPQLRAAREAEGKTRFKMWWRMVGSAIEHAAGLCGRVSPRLPELFLAQPEDDEEESATLADVLEVLVKNMAETVHGERCGGDDQQPVSRARTNRRCATFCCPGAPAAPRVLGKIHRPAAENDTSTSRSAVASARLSCVRGRISTAKCASMASRRRDDVGLRGLRVCGFVLALF